MVFRMTNGDDELHIFVYHKDARLLTIKRLIIHTFSCSGYRKLGNESKRNERKKFVENVLFARKAVLFDEGKFCFRYV